MFARLFVLLFSLGFLFFRHQYRHFTTIITTSNSFCISSSDSPLSLISYGCLHPRLTLTLSRAESLKHLSATSPTDTTTRFFPQVWLTVVVVDEVTAVAAGEEEAIVVTMAVVEEGEAAVTMEETEAEVAFAEAIEVAFAEAIEVAFAEAIEEGSVAATEEAEVFGVAVEVHLQLSSGKSPCIMLTANLTFTATASMCLNPMPRSPGLRTPWSKVT